MLFCSFKGRCFAGVALVGAMLAFAGCQSSDGGGLLGVGGDKQAGTKQAEAQPQSGKVTASSLRAYCPKVILRDGTAYFNTYGNGGRKATEDGSGQDNSANIVYQAAITDVTRDCTHAGGTMTLNIAVAGKVVPGPLGKPGTITMPIRIVVMQGTDDVLYSKLHQYKLQITDMSAATQFVFNDPAVAVPEPTAANYRVFAGFDEGPPAPKTPRKKRVVRKKPPATAAAPAPAQAPGGSQTSISDIPR
jgi:hypothetical protein